MPHTTTPRLSSVDPLLESLTRDSSFFRSIGEGDALDLKIVRSCAVAAVGSVLFGLALGSYAGSFVQLLASAIKLPLLLFGASVLCFPTFYIFQAWQAPRPLGLREALAVQTGSLASVALIWASLSPPIFFLVTSSQNYRLAQWLAVVVGAAGGVVGLLRLLQGCKSLCADGEKGLSHFALGFYFVTFATVGGQLAWMLRPFIGSPSMPFQLFRPYDEDLGNFLSFLVRLILPF